MPLARYAIYYTPLPESPLARFGASVLGYDCFRRIEVPHLAIDGIDPAVLALSTVETRRYGFHGTLTAPFHLNGATEDDLTAALDALAKSHTPVPIGRLAISGFSRFVVLRPAEQHPRIEGLADACLEAFDHFRAPLAAADRQRRMASGLTPRQVELLDRWGYPYVLDEFRFHMSLAGPISNAERREAFEAHLSRAFAWLAADQVEIDAISLMRQDDSAERFHVLRRVRLTGR